MSGEVSEAGAPPPARRWMFFVFVGFMLALTALFLFLGKWQLDRLAWKEGLIAQVAERMKLPPVKLPSPDEWAAFDTETYQYRPVTVSGHFVNDQAVRVFTSLGEAKGKYSGPGYWIMTPFALDGGGTVFVDRGFVPQQLAGAYAPDKTAPEGPLTLTGVALLSQAPDAFTPGPDGPHRIEWVTDVPRLAAFADPALKPFAPIYIDLPAGPFGALPQGGETIVEFPNNHLGYAYTWFGFGLITPIMLAVWIWRQRRRRAGAVPPADGTA